MEKTLGVYVTTDRYLDQLMQLCKAAKQKGVAVKVFFTHQGTRLCTHPRMEELKQYVELALCKVGFEGNRLQRSSAPLEEKAFASQSWHAEMIYDCDRYVTF
jgi:predicted peroxiredoxin